MSNYNIESIRNIALVGAAYAGKTSLIEAALHRSGIINTQGSLERGDMVTDFEPLAKQHQHSLSSAIACFSSQQTHFNLIDTAGAPDLLGHALSILPAVESVGVVINATAGLEMVTRRLLERVKKQKFCRFIVINKIDTVSSATLATLVEEIQQSFGKEYLAINLPANNGSHVVDCFFNPEGEADFSSVAQAHSAIIDQVVEVDEELMAIYLEQGQELAPEQLHNPFEKALREGHLVPICFTSAKTGAGIAELLNLMVKLFPNPLEGNPRPFLKGEGTAAEAFTITPDLQKHVVAHVFKLTADPYLGKLGYFRLHQGVIRKDSLLFIGDGRKAFKVGHLFKLLGKQQIEVEQVIAGDIAAIAKVDGLHFDAVLHDSHDEDFWHIQPQSFPKPMYGLAITPKRQGDEQKVGTVLQKLVEEDPCLQLEHHASLNETVVRGLGELHLRLLLERMQTQFNVEVNTHTPKIPYRETIAMAAEGHYRHKKQTGGAGQFGEVFLRVAPLARGEGFQFVDEIKGGAIPAQFLPAIEKGIQQVLESGAIAGFPLQDLQVAVYDGKFHAVDSKEIAFVSAGKKAFIEAVKKAKPTVLEPIVQLEVTVPADNVGTISGDLATKRGRIMGTDVRGAMMVIKAEVPLSELTQYTNELKSVTAGQGYYTMEFSHYEAVPNSVQQQLAAAYKPVEGEE